MLELIILTIILVALIVKFPRASAWAALVWATGIASFIYGPEEAEAVGIIGVFVVGAWQLESWGYQYKARKEAEAEDEIKAEAEEIHFKNTVKEAVKEATAETVK